MTFDDLVACKPAVRGELQRSHVAALKTTQLIIEEMKVEVAYLRRMDYGRPSERLEHEQLEPVGSRAQLA